MLELTYFGDGRINWHRSIDDFAKEEDKKFGVLMAHLATRRSLPDAATLLGLEGLSKAELNSLGLFLDKHGFTVPPLQERTATRSTSEKHKNAGSEPEKKFNLTREEYLKKRIAGMNRSSIAKEQGIKAPSLYPYLRKWGIKDPIVEEAAMEELKTSLKTVIQISESRSSEESKGVEAVDNSAESVDNESVATSASENTGAPKEFILHDVRLQFSASKKPEVEYITLRIPLRKCEVPRINLVAAGRSQVISDVFVAAQRAVGWIYGDLAELLGTDDVQAQAQQFFDRQFAEYMKSPLTEQQK